MMAGSAVVHRAIGEEDAAYGGVRVDSHVDEVARAGAAVLPTRVIGKAIVHVPGQGEAPVIRVLGDGEHELEHLLP